MPKAFPKIPRKPASERTPKPRPVTARRLIGVDETTTMIGTSRASLYRWMGEGKFPRAIKIGERAIRWDEAEVLAWIDSRRVGGEAA